MVGRRVARFLSGGLTPLLGIVASAAPLSLARAERRIYGSTETAINFFPDPNKRDLGLSAPIIEWLEVNADNIWDKTKDVSAHLSGWSGVDLADSVFDGRVGANLLVGNLKLRLTRIGFEATAGRQFMMLGLGRAERIDGIRLAQDLPAGLRIELFGGLNPGPETRYHIGDYLFGARLGLRVGEILTSGASFVHARKNYDTARELVGADVVLRPNDSIESGAGMLYDTVGTELAQLDVFGTIYPKDALRVGIDWRRVVPVALLDKTSIFSVFSEEVRNELGGDVSWRVHGRVTLTFDAHWLTFDTADNGYRLGAGAQFRLGGSNQTSVVARIGRWKDASDGYVELRGAVRHYFTRALFGVVDLQSYLYDVGRSGNTVSFGATAAVGYEIARRLRALASFEGGVTPLFEQRAQGMLKLEYEFARAF